MLVTPHFVRVPVNVIERVNARENVVCLTYLKTQTPQTLNPSPTTLGSSKLKRNLLPLLFVALLVQLTELFSTHSSRSH